MVTTIMAEVMNAILRICKYAINAAMVKDTPVNDYHDMDSEDTINGDIFRISG